MPWGIPLKPYFDIGYYDSPSLLQPEPSFSDQLLWSGGLMLEIFNGSLEIYFPLINARPLQEQYKQYAGNNYFRRISWSIRFGKVSPVSVAQRMAN